MNARVSYWLDHIELSSGRLECGNAQLVPGGDDIVMIHASGPRLSAEAQAISGRVVRSINYTILLLGPKYNSKFMHFRHAFKQTVKLSAVDGERVGPQVINFSFCLTCPGLIRWYDLDDVIDFARGQYPRVMQFIA